MSMTLTRRPRKIRAKSLEPQRPVRITPQDAYAAQQHGAVLIDIRPEISRDTEGAIPGAWVVDRDVLERRLDPASPTRLDITYLASGDQPLIVVSDAGFSSSSTATTLQALGVSQVTDLIGGYREWTALGLPSFIPKWRSFPD